MSHARSEYKDFRSQAPELYDAILAVSQQAAKAGLDKQLLELVKIRASQINGCAFCVQHHVLLAEKLGVSADKINLVVVWREAPQFSARERAALAFTEAVTLVADTHVPRAAYDAVAEHFTPDEVAALLSLIVVVNAWNMLSVATRAWVPGSYEP